MGKNKNIEFNHKELFIEAASALVDSLSNGERLCSTLYDFGIDIANYVDPAYEFLEDFIVKNFDNEHDAIINMLFDFAQHNGVVLTDDCIIKTVEEVYDYFFKENN